MIKERWEKQAINALKHCKFMFSWLAKCGTVAQLIYSVSFMCCLYGKGAVFEVGVKGKCTSHGNNNNVTKFYPHNNFLSGIFTWR